MFWLRSDYASSQCRAIVHDLIITKALHLERHTVQWFTICNTKRDCIINKQGNAAALHCRSCHGWARGGWAASWVTSPQPFSALLALHSGVWTGCLVCCKWSCNCHLMNTRGARRCFGWQWHRLWPFLIQSFFFLIIIILRISTVFIIFSTFHKIHFAEAESYS